MNTLLSKIVGEIKPSSKRLLNKQLQISEVIIQLLKYRKLSQRGLAKLVKKEESYISKVLGGEVNLTLKTITELEEALNTDIIIVAKRRIINYTQISKSIKVQKSAGDIPAYERKARTQYVQEKKNIIMHKSNLTTYKDSPEAYGLLG